MTKSKITAVALSALTLIATLPPPVAARNSMHHLGWGIGAGFEPRAR